MFVYSFNKRILSWKINCFALGLDMRHPNFPFKALLKSNQNAASNAERRTQR